MVKGLERAPWEKRKELESLSWWWESPGETESLISQIWRMITRKSLIFNSFFFLVWSQELELQSSWKWQTDIILAKEKTFYQWEVSEYEIDYPDRKQVCIIGDVQRSDVQQTVCRGDSFSKLRKSGDDFNDFMFYARSTSVSVDCIHWFLHYKSVNTLFHLCLSTHPLEFYKVLSITWFH